jgi:ABC-type nitrate/sulfonate/bicarbonate transport system substrate-binding protein
MKTLLGAFALCALLGTARAAEQPVTIGINSLTAIYWPTYIARDRHIFQAHGIDPDIILDGSPVAGLQQLVAGSLDIAHPTLAVAVTGASKGAHFIMIGCIVPALPYVMVVPPDVHSAADLKGRTVSLAYKTDVLTALWETWLHDHGMPPGSVDRIWDAQAANRYAALASKVADGALLNAPFDLRALAEGAHVLVDFGPISEGFAMSAVSVRPDWLAANRTAAQAYLRAQQDAIAWLYDTANRDQAIAILARDTKQDAAIAAATYEDYVLHRHPFSRTLDLPDAFVTRTLRALQAVGDTPANVVLPTGLVDRSLLAN